jgi:DnaJ-class molecular chaperone
MFRQPKAEIHIQANIPFLDNLLNENLFGVFSSVDNGFVNQIENKKKKARELLQVGENATDTEIKKAYKKLAVIYHPDKNTNNKEKCSKKFEEITEAKKILLKQQESDNSLLHFASKMFNGFQDEDEELENEVDNLFDFLKGMDFPTPGAKIYQFGKPEQKEQKNLNYRIKIKLEDTWKNVPKHVPIENKYLLKLPLYYKEIIFENNRKYPFSEIQVAIVDRPNEHFKRKGNTWDIETFVFVSLEGLKKKKKLKVGLLDGTFCFVKWGKEYYEKIKKNREKGFYLRDLGLPIDEKKKRGKLWVRFAIDLNEDEIPEENLEDLEDLEDAELLTPEISDEMWWEENEENRNAVFSLENYLSEQ